jgi:hypothetical protein
LENLSLKIEMWEMGNPPEKMNSVCRLGPMPRMKEVMEVVSSNLTVSTKKIKKMFAYIGNSPYICKTLKQKKNVL